MKFTSLFPAVITAIAAAGFTLTDPRATVPTPVVNAHYGSAAIEAAPPAILPPTLLAAFDPLSLAPRVSDADAR